MVIAGSARTARNGALTAEVNNHKSRTPNTRGGFKFAKMGFHCFIPTDK